jgi:integrase/recombinase XerD
MDGFHQMEIEEGMHGERAVIWLYFPYDASLIKEVKQIGAKWSQSKKAWWVPQTQHFRTLFGLSGPVPVGKDAMSKIHPVNQLALQQLEEAILLRGYSPNTLRTYRLEFAQLLYLLKDYPVNDLSVERIRSYVLYCIKELKLSENQVHSRLNAIKFYFEQVLGQQDFMVEIPRPKKVSALPKVLSTAEIKKLFAVTENPKHLLLLQLCYGMGLRVSEVVQLKIEDIDSRRMQVHIRCAKGKKDRYVHLPETVLDLSRQYYLAYRPKVYLLEGQYGGPYSTRSAQAVFKQAMIKARIRKQVGIHSLRHSYATHLHEYGTDISLIKELLGHQQIKTTLIYTHISQPAMAKVSSPLDQLDGF